MSFDGLAANTSGWWERPTVKIPRATRRVSRFIRRQIRDGAAGSVVIAAEVALLEPIVASGQTIFLAEATIAPAKCCTPVTLQKFEV